MLVKPPVSSKKPRVISNLLPRILVPKTVAMFVPSIPLNMTEVSALVTRRSFCCAPTPSNPPKAL